MTSCRSIPSSFDSSSGVRWFATSAPFAIPRHKKARHRVVGGLRSSLVGQCGDGQERRSLVAAIPEGYALAVPAATLLRGFDAQLSEVGGCWIRSFVGGEGSP